MCSRLLRILFCSILVSVLPQTNSFSQSKIASGSSERRTDDSRTAIANLAHCKDLESITEGLTEVSDIELASLSTLPILKTLCLDSDSVSETSLPSLAKIRSLRTLFVTSRVRLTDQQLKSLGEDSLVECQIQLMVPPYAVFHKAQVRN